MIPCNSRSFLVFPAKTCYCILLVDFFQPRFPTSQGQEVLDLWVQNLRRSDFTRESITKNSRVCSRHFLMSDYLERAADQTKKLKLGAVPTVFTDYPKHLQPHKTRKRNCASIEKREAKLACSPRKIARIAAAEHSYNSTEESSTVVDVNQVTEKNKVLKVKVKTLNQKLRRRSKKISTLSGLIQHLKKENKLKTDVASVLEHEFSGLPLELIKNLSKNQYKSLHGQRYSEITKQFAVTLYYHSTKAYEYVRKLLHLPHVSSIRNWCSSVNCKPGFLRDVLDELGKKLASGELSSDISIVIDGMAIRKQTQWSRKEQKYTGFVDYGGNAIVENSELLASEVLCFMVVGIGGTSWKYIIGYFLIQKVTGEVLAQLVRTALAILASSGFRTWSIVWDGTFVNQEAARCLGCKFGVTYESIVTSFAHPTHDYSVHVIFDICHMLKLLRNTL